MEQNFKYGSRYETFNVPEEDIVTIIKPNVMDIDESLTGDAAIKLALSNPVDSAKLRDIVSEGNTVCVVIPDMTRAWQNTSLYIPHVIEELRTGGVRYEDMLIISAVGSHRAQTAEEHEKLVGSEVYSKVRVVDHDCMDKDNLTKLGVTSRGTPVFVNKSALDCDHIVLTGGAILHFLAGYGGGRKYILPGISGFETIMKNHSFSLNEGMGSGANPDVRTSNMSETNILHMDMMEAAAMVKPSFILNVVVDDLGTISHAFAGNYITAHEAACKIVEKRDCVTINEKADLVIASACGFPKDINFYQTSKTLFNAVEAVREKGAVIIVSECSEGFGSPDTEYVIGTLPDMLAREKDLRENYTIGKFIAYKEAELAELFHFILVTAMDPALLSKTNIKVVRSVEEGIALAKTLLGTEKPSVTLMPNGANTFPVLGGM